LTVLDDTMKNLAEEVIEAHGGLARWQATETVRLGLWAVGIAFRTKGHTRTLHDVTATVEVPHPQRHHETRALRLTLPAGLGVHGPNHTLLIDEHGLIQSHDYVATAFGRWALATQSVDDNQPFNGLLLGTRRRVTPRLSPTRGTPGPTLVSIRLHPPPTPD
jgi:hypothetical protein